MTAKAMTIREEINNLPSLGSTWQAVSAFGQIALGSDADVLLQIPIEKLIVVMVMTIITVAAASTTTISASHHEMRFFFIVVSSPSQVKSCQPSSAVRFVVIDYRLKYAADTGKLK